MIKLSKPAVYVGVSVVTFIIVPLVLLSGCKVIQDGDSGDYGKNDVQYGVTRGLFLGRWWDFYERGRSFADGKFWSEAEKDLRKALSVRTKDDRRARTYGAHFIHYFGNRELGVVLFRQADDLYEQGKELYRQGRKSEGDRKFKEGREKIEQAIDYLERSEIRDELSDNDILTDKAVYYLRLCHRQLVKYTHDTVVPIIHLEDIPDRTTNKDRLELVGWIEDNHHVDRLRLLGKNIGENVRLHYRDRKFYFEKTVSLNSGINDFELTAVDSGGNASEKMQLTIVLDRDPPVISIVEATEEKIIVSVINEDKVNLENESLDNVDSLGEIGENIFQFVPINVMNPIYIEFTDSARNRNGILIQPTDLKVSDRKLRYRPHKDDLNSAILLASSQLPKKLPLSAARTEASSLLSESVNNDRTDTNPPIIADVFQSRKKPRLTKA